ncbi:MAG: NFACT family protein, partial [Bacteroidota bacterium]|nr:NFACT family protein [Bacteroidota bacterium]
MLSNYFTFSHIAQALNVQYGGAVVAEVYSQDKNTLSMVLYLPEEHTVTISCGARQNFIVARSGSVRSRKNSVDLFPALIDKHIHSVYMSATDRIVYIKFSEQLYLVAEMFNAKANVLLCSEDGIIVDAFLGKKNLLSEKRILQFDGVAATAAMFLPSMEVFTASFSSSKESAFHIVKKTIPTLGSTLAKESLLRAAIEPESSDVAKIQAEKLFGKAAEIITELLRPAELLSPSLYFDDDTPIAFSLIPLQQYSSLRIESFKSIFTAIQKFLGYERSAESFLQKKK